MFACIVKDTYICSVINNKLKIKYYENYNEISNRNLRKLN